MPHYSEWTFDTLSSSIADRVEQLMSALSMVEEYHHTFSMVYEQLGGTDQLVADAIFRVGEGNSATPSQVAKIADIREAVAAGHDLYRFSNNEPGLGRGNRLGALRKFSDPGLSMVLQKRQRR